MHSQFARLASVVALLAACGGRGERATPDSARLATASPAPAATGAGCQMSGHWQLCSVLDRLEHAGLAPQRHGDTVRHPFLSIPGERLRLGRGQLEVFVYPDAAAMARDVRRLDSTTVSPPGEHVTWSATPTLITSDNLAAVLLSDNERQIERVRDALTAGLPPAVAR